MSSKSEILKAIRNNKPEQQSLPDLLQYDWEGDKVSRFREAMAQNGGKAIVVNNLEHVKNYLQEQYEQDKLIVSLVEGVDGNWDVTNVKDPHELEHIEAVVLKAELGVAENAAMWFSEESMHFRVLPFIAQHSIVILEKEKLLTDMHQAYLQVDVAETGFGVFIAGPSKTADIEQSLVIGAHGPRSMTVFLV